MSDGIDKTLISESVTQHFLIRDELWALEGDPSRPTEMKAAHSFGGDYIGNVEDAYALTAKGIVHFERREPDSKVCSIGFSPSTEKWYGWSHRAIYGYGVGDIVKPGTMPVEDFENGGECLYDVKPGMKVETLDDAKRAAKAFARSVS